MKKSASLFDGITRADLLSLASANNIKDATAVIDEECEAAGLWTEMAGKMVPQRR